jgi:hypothetical protein
MKVKVKLFKKNWNNQSAEMNLDAMLKAESKILLG